MARIRVVLYGLGKIGRLAARLMIDKGVEIVAAIDRPGSASAKLSRDLADVVGLPHPVGVIVSDDADRILSTVKAEIVFVAVRDDMQRMFPIYERCLRHGFNVVTVGSEASFSWRSAPERTETLHRLAISRGVTLCGTGNQDLFMVNAASMASGVCHRLDRITHVSLTDVNDFGAEVAAISHVGATLESYAQSAAAASERGDNVYLYFWENLCADLGLEITDIRQRSEPLLHEKALYCQSLNLEVPPGRTVGTRSILELDTREGIALKGEYLLRLCAPDESQFKSWRLEGQPNLQLDFRDLNPGFTTVSQPVNRIPDIINSPPGYVTLEKLPKLKYRAHPFETYVNR